MLPTKDTTVSVDQLRQAVSHALLEFQAKQGVELPCENIAALVVQEATMAVARHHHADERARLIEQRDALILAEWRDGVVIRDIALSLAVTVRTVQTVIEERTTEAERIERQRHLTGGFHERSFTEDEALEAIRHAAGELGRSPSAAKYDRLARERGWPRQQSVAMHFGTWSVAVEKAGLKPYGRPRGMGLPKYSDEDYIAALRRVETVIGHPPSVGQYNALRQEGEPTAHSFRKKFGHWVGALEHCCKTKASRVASEQANDHHGR